MLHPIVIVGIGLVLQVIGTAAGLFFGVGYYFAVVAGGTAVWLSLGMVVALVPWHALVPRPAAMLRPVRIDHRMPKT